MPRTSRIVVASAVVGAVLGVLCARVVLVGSAVSLIPWAVAALAVGAVPGTGRLAATAGAAYGFALSYAFMLAGYDGEAALRTRLAPFLVFGLVGAVCGTFLGVLGAALRPRRHVTNHD